MSKIYNINPKEITLGQGDSAYTITAIALGESGRGRLLTYVPAPKDAVLLEVGTTKSGKPRLDASKSEQGWIARISTDGAYIRGANGNVSVHPDHADNVTVIARGYGAFGDAGRTGNWDDLLIHVKDDQETLIRVKPTRGDAYLLLFKGNGATKLPYPEAELADLDLADSAPTAIGRFVRLKD